MLHEDAGTEMGFEEVPRDMNRARLLLPHFYSRSNGVLGIHALFYVKSDAKTSIRDAEITINGEPHPATFHELGLHSLSNRHFGILQLELTADELVKLPIHNAIRLVFGDESGFCRPITYNALIRKYKAAHGPMLELPGAGVVAFFRQTAKRGLILTVRNKNITDGRLARIKLSLASLVARFIPESKRPVLIYEKNAGKYGESGKAVYQRLVDLGNNNVRFVLPADLANSDAIEDRYKKQFVVRHSFRHYVTFFAARTFIGTEAMAHALELRVQHRRAQEKLRDSSNRFVFLQHGVMYMVSLDSPQRSSFRRKAMPDTSKIVVSSELEARHFTELADFSHDDLIISGLPKFDLSYMNPGADKIIIMPTWRIWEFNIIRSDPSRSGYSKMIESIVEGIPNYLKDKVVVVPHPLFDASTFGAKPTHDDLDVMLRDACMLITDYSSIAYDAFYRGANVIFYWADKDECMEHYGEPTHLMIDEETAFGPVCYSSQDVNRSVDELYGKGQKDEYVSRYRRIVSFHDGKNTDRLINSLESDGILSPAPR